MIECNHAAKKAVFHGLRAKETTFSRKKCDKKGLQHIMQPKSMTYIGTAH
jgi:hypothetical protein